MKRKILLFLWTALLLTTQVEAQKTATLVLQPDTKYQHIDGFGAAGMSGQWGDVFTDDMVEKMWGQDDGQVGLNIMRVRIDPSESDWGNRNAGYARPIRKARSINASLKVFATPWTPPYQYKTHNDDKYQNDFGTWVYPSWQAWGFMPNGGAINPECYDDYADFLERYRQMMENHGAPVDIISIQNECDYTPTDEEHTQATYESCIYSPSEMAAMAKAARGKVDSKCQIMGPECFGWDQHIYNRALLNIPDAVENIDLWGNHIYGTNDWSFVQEVTNQTGKHMWMTEFYIANEPTDDNPFSTEYEMVSSLEKVISSGYSAYVYWGADGAFFSSDANKTLTKRAYVFSHYAKYATGKQRIHAKFTDRTKKLVGGSSYMSDDGNTITVFLLNPTSDEYNVTITLPWEAARITQITTGNSVSFSKADVTSKYNGNGNKPRVKLLPRFLYTFQFEKEAVDDGKLDTSVKKPRYGNPLIAHRFTADATAIEHEGRLYVYGTNDQEEYDFSDGLSGNSYGHICQLSCISTTDMVNWTDHGIIDVRRIAPWAWASWAPSIVSRKDANGKEWFYLYFTTGGSSIGVLKSESPTGPWSDPLGHALISGSTPGLGKMTNLLDPGVAVNDDGTEAYITFGGGDPNSEGSSLMPGNTRIAKLADNMISLASDVKRISSPYHFEANELNYIGGQWVFSYCTHWGERDSWTEYREQHGISVSAPSACSMVYMTATDPMADQWKYRGEYLPNPGMLGYPWGNNHTHIHKYKGNYYVFYHTQWVESQLGVGGGYRNLHANKMTVTESTATLQKMQSSNTKIYGVSQLASDYVRPFEEQSAAMAAIKTKNWWMVRGVDFGTSEEPAQSLILRVKGSGTLEVYLKSLDESPLATATFSSMEEQTVQVALNDTPSERYSYVYFVVRGSDAEVLSWQFSTEAAGTGIDEVQPLLPAADHDSYYTVSGMRTRQPSKGISIVRGADGRVRKVLSR